MGNPKYSICYNCMDSVPLRPLKALHTSSSPSCLSLKQPTRSPITVRQRAGAAPHGLGCVGVGRRMCQQELPAGDRWYGMKASGCGRWTSQNTSHPVWDTWLLSHWHLPWPPHSTFFPEDHPKLLRLLVLWYGSQILTSSEEGISVDFPAVPMPRISLQPGRKADPIVPDVAEKSNSEQKGMFPQRMMWLLWLIME